MADFITLNVNYSHRDPFFHSLSDRFGSRVESNSWGFSADVDLLKLLPFNSQDNNLRVNYSRTESIGKPLYQPGTDIKVSEAQRLLYDKLISENVSDAVAKKQVADLAIDAQTLNVSETWTLANIKLKIPSNYWLIRDTWNSLSFGFNYNKAFGRSPTVLLSRSWLWNANMGYALNISPDYSFYPYTIPYIGKLLGLSDDYKALKIYYLPQTISYNISARRSHSYMTNRPTETVDAEEIPSLDFSTARGLNSLWKMSENGFLNLTLNYNFSATSTLTYLETDSSKNERSESRIWRDILSGVFFGQDLTFTQTIDLKTSPKLPSLWDINKYVTLTAGYNVNYNWNNAPSQPVLGRSIGFRNSSTIGLNLRLKGLLDPLFKDDVPDVSQNNVAQEVSRRPELDNPRQIGNEQSGRLPPGQNGQGMPGNAPGAPGAPGNVAPGGQGNPPGTAPGLPDNVQNAPPANLQDVAMNSEKNGQDSAKTIVLPKIGPKDTTFAKKDSLVRKNKIQIFKSAYTALKVLSRIMLADYENLQFNFTNNNTYSSSGIAGTGNGLKNFWDIRYEENRGPSRLYMFGLSGDAGPRAINGSLSDNFAQQNTLDFRTSKPLWEGAHVDINWKVGWSISKSTSLQTDSLGNVSINNVISTGSISRSFLSFPPVFPFSLFKSGIKRVNDIYQAGPQDQVSLSSAFVQGFESMPWLSKLPFLQNFAEYIPRPNWHITWDGLEKLSFLKGFTKKVSLDHAYTSDYTEGWKLTDGSNVIQSQKISVGFQPLIGLNMTFVDLWSGSLTGSFKFSTQSGYNLGISTQNISEDYSKEIGITLNYAKSGFEVPLFGISLKNDIEFSVTYSSTHTSSILYDMTQFTEAGVPQNGTIRTTLNPTIKYVISSRVTMSVFYNRSKTEPEGTAQIPPTTVNEAGMDIRISIQ
jgi:cell surface protein SprA